MRLFLAVFLTFSFCCQTAVFSQQTNIYTSKLSAYKYGMELFAKQKFGAAQHQFYKAKKRINDPNNEASINTEYYIALCALELFNKDARFLLTEFVQNHPESPMIKLAYFQLGRYNYRKHKWHKVLAWLNKVDMYDLTDEEVAEYHFKKGYSHFMLGDLKNASNSFFEIKDVDTKYTVPARYYFSHIAYSEGNYQTALEGFKHLKNDKKFAKVVPYYITQIYYLQKKFDKLLTYAPALLDSATPKRAPEIARLIGDAYYQKENYKKAIPYLEQYKNNSYNKINNQDKYQLGYAYYKSGAYKKAIKIFNKLSSSGDKLAQTAYYHLADCYIKTNDKKFALNAFKSATDLSFDKKIQEDALFNYALLSYDLSYDPYNKSITAFQEYIERYPNSDKTDEAYGYLLNVYMTTKNYASAMKSIELMKKIDSRLQGAYQRIAFNLGVEKFVNKKYYPAIANFKKALQYPVDRKLNTASTYWIGESYYKKHKYKLAINNYKAFIFEPGAILQKEFNTVNYNIGYSYFKLKTYNNAALWLRKFTANQHEKDSIKLADANLRIGDSYFIQKNYFNAERFYQAAIDLNQRDRDYAIYQRAIAFGVMRKSEVKQKMLTQLLKEYPTSKYAVDAKYQMAKLNVLHDKPTEALTYYEDIIKNYPNSSYVKKSMLNVGLIYYNKNEDQKALDIFHKIIKNYPTYDDSKEALSAMKNIYVRLGQVDRYAALMQELSFVNITEAALDSVTYEAAELQYLDSKCELAMDLFTKYLDKFTPPIYDLNAHFYRGECLYRSNKIAAALADYEVVNNKPLNKFSESALLKSARIKFVNHQFQNALSNYITLEKIAEYSAHLFEAQEGQMKCFFFLDNYTEALKYANIVLEYPKLNESSLEQSHLIKAKSWFNLDSITKAYTEFEFVATQTRAEKSAESRYNMAKIQYDKDSLQLAESQVFELVNQSPSYAYWVAKGLILLSNIYVKTEDLFQAKATLQSIVDNYKGDKLKLEAQDKLNAIIDNELKEKEEAEKEKELEIEFNDNELQNLFEEEQEEVEDPINN